MTSTLTPAQSRIASYVFNLLGNKYVQRADSRQAEMGLQYMEAETHDLAETIARIVTKFQEAELEKLKLLYGLARTQVDLLSALMEGRWPDDDTWRIAQACEDLIEKLKETAQ